MNLRLFSGYVLAIAAVVILAAAGMLLVGNLRLVCDIHLFIGNWQVSTSAVLLLSAVGGVVLWWTLRRLLPKGVSALRAGARLRREKQAQKQLKDLTGRPKQGQPKP